MYPYSLGRIIVRFYNVNWRVIINTKLKSLIDSNPTLNKTALFGTILVAGYKESEARAALKEAGITGSKSSFRAELYDTLAMGTLSAKDFKALIENESANVLKSESHYNEIRILVNAVRFGIAAKLKVEAEEKVKAKAEVEAIAEAKAKAEAEAKAKAKAKKKA